MKRFISFLILLPVLVFAQKTDTTSLKNKFIGFTFSPDYCYRSLDSDPSVQWIADSRNEYEIPKFGFTAGVNFKLKMNKRFSLETAILLSDKGEKTKDFSNFTSSTGEVDPLLPVAVNFNYHYTYLDIPIKANYYILTKKAKLFLTAGVSSNIFLFQKTTTSSEYMDGHKERNSSFDQGGFSRINLAVLAGLGFEYALSDRLHLKFEPIYRQSITPIMNTPIKEYLYSFGMNSGVYYSL